MTKLDEVNAEVNSKATTPISQIQSGYSTACNNLLSFFLMQLMEVISLLEQIMAMLDAAKMDLEPFGDIPSPPDLPPFPSSDLPDVSLDWGKLDCPMAKCLGFPAIPAVKFPTGINFDPKDTAKMGQYREYAKALGQSASAYGKYVGTAGEANAKNALTLLKNTPAYIANGLIEAAQSAIASLLSETVLKEMDATIACITATDSRLNNATEIVRYKALRSRLQHDASGKPNLDMSENLKSKMTEFTSKNNAATAKLKSSQGLLSKAKKPF